MRLSILSTIAAAVMVASAVRPAAAEPIKVGSKNFTEQYILAEMYAALLEKAGFQVERKINLGGTLIAHQALTTGQIDLYPEYTGTALSSVVKGTMSTDPDKVYNEVKDFYAKNYNLTWLKPTGINNGYVIVVRNETADANNLKSLSDLAKVANTLVFGGGAEFPDRADGLPGLKRVYNAEFKEFKQFAKLGLRYDALSQKDIDVANGAATDWQIGAQGLTALDDDKGLFPPYYVAPVVRQQVLDANPKLKDVLESLGSHLDNATMRVLNAKVETDHEEPKDVAEAFLKEKGLLP
ncbi:MULTISPECIES: glycine betaine ABC transporter substrate-binding protein [unclassified Rhizobium]|uniref:glycine betaine ABC transporter substrate-binding protein n=1 Tax=unclassified Rhizobium TaxID=2613769 RepID=UPI0006491043|nr:MULTISPECIES: glycine betaine ABC transporter substrate-binding protein [unclassified Rhizobium]NKJ06443.1 osmoprotectant transport system substrate-binding protein [Rhizobium sp. SG741]NKJ38522.1 osmoprotectant transport system substrate-binding protein [Rhizobium sp. SG570]